MKFPTKNPVAVLTVLSALTATSLAWGRPSALRLGEESIPSTEAADAETVKEAILEKLREAHAAAPGEIVGRDAHPKAHGCVKAEFRVKGGLDPAYAQGLFAQPASYRAWIRYSNGSQSDSPDSNPDGRGMAIKVLGVPGAKILPNDETATQDFLMIHHDVFFVRNASDYISFTKNPLLFLGMRPFHEGKIAFQTARKKITSPFESSYWSMTPYRLGLETRGQGRAMKYRVRPVSCAGAPLRVTPESPNRDFLREAMISTLRSGDVCFDFQIQLQTDASLTPIEDPTISWDDAGAPFATVASIRITKAENDGKLGTRNRERTQFCENIAMSPWHSLPEHRPLGGINRVRKTVYQAISIYRREMNGVRPPEPTGNERF